MGAVGNWLEFEISREVSSFGLKLILSLLLTTVR